MEFREPHPIDLESEDDTKADFGMPLSIMEGNFLPERPSLLLSELEESFSCLDLDASLESEGSIGRRYLYGVESTNMSYGAMPMWDSRWLTPYKGENGDTQHWTHVSGGAHIDEEDLSIYDSGDDGMLSQLWHPWIQGASNPLLLEEFEYTTQAGKSLSQDSADGQEKPGERSRLQRADIDEEDLSSDGNADDEILSHPRHPWIQGASNLTLLDKFENTAQAENSLSQVPANGQDGSTEGCWNKYHALIFICIRRIIYLNLMVIGFLPK